MSTLKESNGFEPEVFSAPVCGEALWFDGGSLDRQDFEDGCFQTRARRAAQSLGRVQEAARVRFRWQLEWQFRYQFRQGGTRKANSQTGSQTRCRSDGETDTMIFSENQWNGMSWHVQGGL